MGQKVNPISLRLGINRNWNSRWFPNFSGTAADNLLEDYNIRKFVKKEYGYAGIDSILIERTAKRTRVSILTARPGILIGKNGEDVEKLKNRLAKITKGAVDLNIKDIKKAQLSAQLGAENIAQQLERRVAYRKAMKKVMFGALKSGAKGVKVKVSGRLGGAEMAREDWYMEGRVPLHTLRAKIDYGFAEALTTYGNIGVKMWVFRGEVIKKSSKLAMAEKSDKQPRAKRVSSTINKEAAKKSGE